MLTTELTQHGWEYDEEHKLWCIPGEDEWYVERVEGSTQYRLVHEYSWQTMLLSENSDYACVERHMEDMHDAYDEARWSQHEESLLAHGVPEPDYRTEHDV